MKIVILDGYTVNPGDLDWEPVHSKGEVVLYDRTPPAQIMERSRDADILLVNKVRINAELLRQLPSLKGICMLATGYDNVDVSAAKAQGVKVYNAVGYGSESVAQHVIAMILAWTNKVESHHQSIQAGDWTEQSDFSYTLNSVTELKGKTLGIYGFGKIGSRLGELGRCFGMRVLAISRNPKEVDGIHFVDDATIFSESDFLSLHVPLTDDTNGLISADTLKLMKPEAVLINTGRGALIRDGDLIKALCEGTIAGACLDVLQTEPPTDHTPLIHAPNVLLTPHMAWSSRQARRTLIQMAAENIDRVSSGASTNRVV